jgi:SAM-dependent methyltransferase
VQTEGALAHYADPSYYSKTYARRKSDVAYYVKLAREHGGPVLEYGVGNGRVALEIARKGVEVTGIDWSRPMLEDLRTRLRREPGEVRTRVRSRFGDMRSVRLGSRFPLVIAPFNVVLHLYSRRDVERFLARVREHLRPSGRLIFDYSMPQPADLCRDPLQSFGAPPIRYPRTNQLVGYRERFEYDPLRQTLLVRMEFQPKDGAPGWSVPLSHRQFFPQEMLALLHYNGFEDIVCTADFTGRAPGPYTDSMVVSATTRRRR